jgi:hypothetical protein
MSSEAYRLDSETQVAKEANQFKEILMEMLEIN